MSELEKLHKRVCGCTPWMDQKCPIRHYMTEAYSAGAAAMRERAEKTLDDLSSDPDDPCPNFDYWDGVRNARAVVAALPLIEDER